MSSVDPTTSGAHEDLRGVLALLHARGEQLPIAHVVAIASAVAIALHRLHEQGTVHGDVAPRSIFVGRDGSVRVADASAEPAPAYMAPERCIGKPIDRRSDVFSLGTVLFELVTGRRVFKTASDFLTMSAIIAGELPLPSLHRKDLPPAIEDAVLKALARDPGERFQMAIDLAAALEAHAKTTPAALGDYIEQLLAGRSAEATDDFDGAETGLARPPQAAIDELAIPAAIIATVSSPIARARTRAVAAAATKSSTTADSATGVVDLSKDDRRRTPPPMPSIVVAGRSPRDEQHTAIVKVQRMPTHRRLIESVRDHWKRWTLGAAAGVFVVLFAMIGFSGSVPEGHGEPAAKPQAPPPPPAQKPWDQVTARDYEAAKPAPPPVEPAPAIAPPPPPPVEPAPAVASPPPQPQPPPPAAAPVEPIADPMVEPPAKHEPPARPPAKKPKPQIKPARPAATKASKPPPKWDPDSLVPGK